MIWFHSSRERDGPITTDYFYILWYITFSKFLGAAHPKLLILLKPSKERECSYPLPFDRLAENPLENSGNVLNNRNEVLESMPSSRINAQSLGSPCGSFLT